MFIPEHAAGQSVIGVSIRIPEPWAGQLRALRRSFGDPVADLVPPHVTVVGPTAVEDDEMRSIEAHLGQVARATRPFRIELRGSGTFRPTSPVVFLKVADGAEACAELEARARAGLLAGRLRFPYHPHVTVAHDVPEPVLDRALAELADFSADIEVGRIWRYEPDPSGVWRPRRAFDLVGGI